MVLRRLDREIDIRQLNVEVPQPETTPRIDIEHIIDERYWQELNNMFEANKALITSAVNKPIFELAANMRLLFPNRKISLDDMEISESSWEKAPAYAEAVLKPETRKGSPQHLQAEYERLMDAFWASKDMSAYIELLTILYQMKLIYPESAGWAIQEKDWKEIKPMIENSDAFFSMAIIKMIYPEYFKDLDIKPEYWREWQEALELPGTLKSLSFTGINDLLRLALSLKILSAKEAKITPNGIEVVDEDPIIAKNDPTPVPEERSF
jgi:hypothetical protein